MSKTTTPSTPEDRDPVQELETNLAALVPGLRILDRQLELSFKGGSSGRVDFAGTDAEGHLVLVLLLDGSGDSAALAALDLFVLARRHAALVARHLELDPSQTGPPRLILVADSFDDQLVGRLAVLEPAFELFSIEVLRSERGARSYLVPHATTPRTNGDELVRVTREAFMEGLGERQRAPAELLIDRLARMDSEVKPRYSDDGVRWTFQGHEFLGLALQGDELVGFVLPAGRDMRLDSQESVEHLVEAAFGAYVRLLGLAPGPETDLGSAPFGAADSDDGPGAGPDDGPLLSAEEIAAFQA